MKKAIAGSILAVCAACRTFGQSAEEPPKFLAADIHASAKVPNPFFRTSPARGGRYEVRNATMLDLIRTAYDFDADKVLGGPNWLELDRFDVIGRVPPDSAPEQHKQMLRAALEERFQLAVHKETKPLPAYALTAGKKPQLKEASGSEQTGCKPKAASGSAPQGGIRLMMGNADGTTTTLNLGPGMTVEYQCRNLTMEQFAANMRSMIGTSLGQNGVVDETGLKGVWNFDLTYSMQLIGPNSDNTERISIFNAVEKQLGLKLEERQIPTPVLVVDKVNRKPSDNPPGVAEALPEFPPPSEFEVATIKPTDPNTRMGRFQMQAGGRLNVEGMPLRFLLDRAFQTSSRDQIVGLPSSLEMDRYDVAAKMPNTGKVWGPGDIDEASKALLALLVDRFHLKYHQEERPLVAYSLVAAKPKMKKADPDSRIFCKNQPAPPGAPPGSRMMKCQNASMAQFAERLQNQSPDLSWPVLDATGLEGAWDFTLTFSMRPMMAAGAGRGGAEAAGPPGNAVPSASDPGGGYTLFEAIEKQLGLKLEKQKRNMPVFVIDHIDPKPATDN